MVGTVPGGFRSLVLIMTGLDCAPARAAANEVRP